MLWESLIVSMLTTDRGHLKALLAEKRPHVNILITSFHLVKGFEMSLVDPKKKKSESSATPLLSSVFDPYLHIWVEAKDR